LQDYVSSFVPTPEDIAHDEEVDQRRLRRLLGEPTPAPQVVMPVQKPEISTPAPAPASTAVSAAKTSTPETISKPTGESRFNEGNYLGFIVTVVLISTCQDKMLKLCNICQCLNICRYQPNDKC